MKYVASLLLIIASINGFSQYKGNEKLTKVEISGTVIDFDTKEPLEYATIVLKPLNGKSITGGITNENGKFSIEVSKGPYDISVEFISFKTKTIKNKILKENTNLGTILLQINVESLNEVEIIAEKSTVEIRLDKKIYNVGKDMTVKGGTASDVLDNVPSVSVDVEGNVSLRGNENVRILVNGKPSGLVGLGGTDALRQLPADAIEKVEVITSPSARYDAEGTAGILNIILRKGKAQGFNASISSTLGIPKNIGLSTNINYRTKKANFFTNTGYSIRKSPGNSLSNVTYYDNDATITNYRNEVIDYDREQNGFNTRFGMEYFLTEKSSLTGAILYRKSDGDDLSTNLINNFNNLYNLTSSSTRLEEETEKDETIEYSFNYTKDFEKSGHKLTFDFQYGTSEEQNFTNISDTNNNPERNSTNEKDSEIEFKGDYTLPIGENSQFEFGFRVNLDKLDSDYLVEKFENNQFVNNANFSNNLDFEQNVTALYSQYGKKINKFSYLLGLRVENTDRKINLEQNNEVYNKNWTELFPTINLGLEFTDTESLTLGYSRRLRRPRHYFLNPFESRTSETYIRKGNVNLDPTYTNSFDLGYLKKWDKFTLNSSLYYQHSLNSFEMVQIDEWRDSDGNTVIYNEQNPNPDHIKVVIRTPINLSNQDRYGFEFTANYNPYKWWRLSNSFNFFKSVIKGDFDNISYDAENISWFTNLTSRITLPGKIDWQTRGMYMAPFEGAQSTREGFVSINLAFSKDLFKEKATISFNVSDLLNSRKRKSETLSPTTYTYSEFQYRERQFLLNFTYRFNQKKQRERQSGYNGNGDDEMF